jgi:hypothetical protein
VSAEQVFWVGEPEAPGSWRQMSGQAAFWELHQLSRVGLGTELGSID